jgi:hypothetical protein
MRPPVPSLRGERIVWAPERGRIQVGPRSGQSSHPYDTQMGLARRSAMRPSLDSTISLLIISAAAWSWVMWISVNASSQEVSGP